MEPINKCDWEYQSEDGYYETQCNRSYYYCDDGMLPSPEEDVTIPDDFRWCPYCGGVIKAIYPPEAK
jgi:hypothetical protein